MELDVHETSASSSQSSIQLIDLTEEEQEAPFAVREADGSVDAVPGRIPDRAEIFAWLEEHPVVVGIATGLICFSLIAGAMSLVVGSDSNSAGDDPVAGAALSETDGSQGSFSSSGSSGANFTSDESKLSRTGAGKLAADTGDGESATGAGNNPKSAKSQNSRNPQNTEDPQDLAAPDRITPGTSNLDQRATINTTASSGGNGLGRPSGPATTADRSPGAGTNPNPNSSPTTVGANPSTLNPGPNVNNTVTAPATTTTTRRSSTSTRATNPTTPTSSVQTSSTSQSTLPTTPTTSAPTTPTTSAPTTPTTAAPTTATTTPTTPATIPTTAPPVNLSIAAPGNGTSHRYDTPTNFAANFVSGATQYCWTFTQSGTTTPAQCSSGTTYQLPARPGNLDPGAVTATVTATGSFGTRTASIQISLYRDKVLNNPTRDVTIGKGALRVGVVNMSGADRYCFRLTQSGYDSGDLCYTTTGNTFNKKDPIWDFLSPGPLTVRATIFGGGTKLAEDSVTINLL